MTEIERYCSKCNLKLYTWYSSVSRGHDTICKLWSDSSSQCEVSGQLSRCKGVVICHPASNEGFFNGALLLCGKKLSELLAGYHGDMNGKEFEDWFENVLVPELPKERNVVIVMDHAKYHSRLIEKTPLVNMKKDYIIKFMVKHNKDIPNPVPTKPVLLEKIRKRNVPKQYVIDLEDKKVG